MIVTFDTSTVRETRWYEYALRFLFGGFITAAAGVIAKEFGPTVGGLFLAFPAIFPASATLIEKHQREKKQQKGMNGKQRGRDAAALEAAGAALGSLALFLFAVLVWSVLPHYKPAFVLTAATALWASASVGLWFLRRRC